MFEDICLLKPTCDITSYIKSKHILSIQGLSSWTDNLRHLVTYQIKINIFISYQIDKRIYQLNFFEAKYFSVSDIFLKMRI